MSKVDERFCATVVGGCLVDLTPEDVGTADENARGQGHLLHRSDAETNVILNPGTGMPVGNPTGSQEGDDR